MGFVQQFSVGSRVWLDMNSNGVYDEDEDSGIGNVTLAVCVVLFLNCIFVIVNWKIVVG